MIQRVSEPALLWMICLCMLISPANVETQTNTDEVGFTAVDWPKYFCDTHDKILHQLGLNHTRMEVRALGRMMRLVEDSRPIQELVR
jgi:hypothetical protein